MLSLAIGILFCTLFPFNYSIFACDFTSKIFFCSFLCDFSFSEHLEDGLVQVTLVVLEFPFGCSSIVLKTYDGLLSDISWLFFPPQLLYKPFPFYTSLLSLSYSILIPLPGFSPSVGAIIEDGPGRSVLRIPWAIPLPLHSSLVLTCNWTWHMPFPVSAAILTLACYVSQSMFIAYFVVLLLSGLLDVLLSPSAFSHTDADNIQVLWIFVV